MKQLDPQTQQLLSQLNATFVPFREIPVLELRKASEKLPLAPLPGIKKIETITIPQSPIHLRIYSPEHKASLLPVFLFIHGGGWCHGSLNEYDWFCQELSKKGECLVVSVDYRLAPEHPFPEPLEDCYRAAQWVEKHIHEYGGLPEKIAIGGDSAGGNLAAATTLLARERQSPHFIYQVLICPALNYNFDTLSYSEFSERYFLTTEDTKYFWNTYLQLPENGMSPYASPLKTSRFTGLPNACIVIAHFDPVRDDGMEYAHRLSQAGIATTLQSFDSIHGFYGYPELEIASEAISFIAEQLMLSFKAPS